MTHFVPLAADLDENKVTPGVLGFIVFAVLAVAVWLLMKSMSRHMGKVDFHEGHGRAEGEQAPEETRTAASGSGPASSRGK